MLLFVNVFVVFYTIFHCDIVRLVCKFLSSLKTRVVGNFKLILNKILTNNENECIQAETETKLIVSMGFQIIKKKLN